MDANEFRDSVNRQFPPADLAAPLAALWWDAKGDWTQAHGMVDELETNEGMAVHAYLHRKEGSFANADYWYDRAGRQHHRPELEEEWKALVSSLLSS